MASDSSSSESSDDVISLEDLVKDTESPEAAATTALGAPTATTDARPKAPAEAPVGTPEIDNLLAAEDPSFAASMSELHRLGETQNTTGEADIESLDVERLAREKQSFVGRVFYFLTWPFRRASYAPNSLGNRILRLPVLLGPLVVKSIGSGFRGVKGSLGAFSHALKKALANFKAMNTKSKLMVGAVVVLGALSIVTLKMTIGGRLAILNIEPGFLRSFADVADAKYTYDENEPMEDFTDPLFHPEHVILFDKIVVNLRQPRDGSSPMGLFEFYFEASNQESAVELKDRQGEARDIISRTLEQLPYDELVTAPGKERMKVALRKNLNAFLTRGQIRRVYLKTIVLKP